MLSGKRKQSGTWTRKPPDVPINGPEYRAYVKEQRALLQQIADELGQLPARIGKIEVEGQGSLTDFDTIALDASGQWHAVQ
jgi:hypothetical protein